MKKVLIAILALACCSIAHASESSHRAAVEKMLQATKVESNLDILYKQFGANIDQQFKLLDVPDDVRPILTKFQNQQIDVMREELSWQKLKDNIASAYLKVYSEAEVVELTKFFTSPIGVKYVERMPELMQEMNALIQAKLPILGEKYQRIAEEMADEMKKAVDSKQKK